MVVNVPGDEQVQEHLANHQQPPDKDQTIDIDHGIGLGLLRAPAMKPDNLGHCLGESQAKFLGRAEPHPLDPLTVQPPGYAHQGGLEAEHDHGEVVQADHAVGQRWHLDYHITVERHEETAGLRGREVDEEEAVVEVTEAPPEQIAERLRHGQGQDDHERCHRG